MEGRAGRQTETNTTKLISTFRYFENVPKNVLLFSVSFKRSLLGRSLSNHFVMASYTVKSFY